MSDALWALLADLPLSPWEAKFIYIAILRASFPWACRGFFPPQPGLEAKINP